MKRFTALILAAAFLISASAAFARTPGGIGRINLPFDQILEKYDIVQLAKAGDAQTIKDAYSKPEAYKILIEKYREAFFNAKDKETKDAVKEVAVIMVVVNAKAKAEYDGSFLYNYIFSSTGEKFIALDGAQKEALKIVEIAFYGIAITEEKERFAKEEEAKARKTSYEKFKTGAKKAAKAILLDDNAMSKERWDAATAAW
ncbi:hypothetical protein Dip510_001948 [Elusimicrobium posterum]|uniref:hypothetical protein n=1 Tax=Elusimicrobium posterum TaxID=3116653 RepID=UPI003C7070F8